VHDGCDFDRAAEDSEVSDGRRIGARGRDIKEGVLYFYATLAQLVERLIRNQQVASSILAGGSSFSIT
jgi:hypothetical protein